MKALKHKSKFTFGSKNCLGINKRKYVMPVNEIAGSSPRVEERQVQKREEVQKASEPEKIAKDETSNNKEGLIATA